MANFTSFSHQGQFCHNFSDGHWQPFKIIVFWDVYNTLKIEYTLRMAHGSVKMHLYIQNSVTCKAVDQNNAVHLTAMWCVWNKVLYRKLSRKDEFHENFYN